MTGASANSFVSQPVVPTTLGTPASTAARTLALAASLASARVSRKASAKAGPFATHSRAKDWAYAAPDGAEYRFRNLALFVREHADLFDGVEAAVVRRHLAHLRTSQRAPDWRGWRWIGSPPARRQRAKAYTLRSPDGVEHRFSNMRLFIKEHAEMFAPEDLKPYNATGLSPAAVCLGALRSKPGNRHKSWKGWTWSAGPAAPESAAFSTAKTPLK